MNTMNTEQDINQEQEIKKELDAEALEKVDGGAGHYYLAARQEREEAERRAQFEKEHPGKAVGTW